MVAEVPPPPFLTEADTVNRAPADGLLWLTDGDETIKSGWPCCAAAVSCTVIGTATEQLFVVSFSSGTAFTHAP